MIIYHLTQPEQLTPEFIDMLLYTGRAAILCYKIPELLSEVAS